MKMDRTFVTTVFTTIYMKHVTYLKVVTRKMP